MPVTLTYPGVYIAEIDSGVRTISGVSTSVTAFIGYAGAGPVNEPVRIHSFSDYERRFGSLDRLSEMSYAVRQFFSNGGSDALIVRIARKLTSATLTWEAGTQAEIVVTARQAGEQGNSITLISAPGPAGADNSLPNKFTLTVTKGDSVETFADLTLANAEKEVNTSALVTLKENGNPTVIPSAAPTPGLATIALLTPAPDSPPSKIRFRLRLDGGAPALIEAGLSAAAAAVATDIQEAVRAYAPSKPAFANFRCEVAPAPAAAPNSGEATPLPAHKRGQAAPKRREMDPAAPPSHLRFISGTSGPNSSVVLQPASDTDSSLFDFPSLTSEPGTAAALRDGGQDPIMGNEVDLFIGSQLKREGIFALDPVDFNLLCLPGVTHPAIVDAAATYCEKRRAFLIVDPPKGLKGAAFQDFFRSIGKTRNAAVYYPSVLIPDLLDNGNLRESGTAGTLAGLYSRTDSNRGVWKAPAGVDATLRGVQALADNLIDAQNGDLNQMGVNCLRNFPATGPVAWGARTIVGSDEAPNDYKYIPVRRLALFIEESLFRGTQWVVFEPNDEPLWAQIRLNVGAFMNSLFRQGAFQGTTPRQAFFVKCDSETTTQNDINRGSVNILVGFAPLKPAEFVIVSLQQIAGQIQT